MRLINIFVNSNSFMNKYFKQLLTSRENAKNISVREWRKSPNQFVILFMFQRVPRFDPRVCVCVSSISVPSFFQSYGG